MSEIDLHKLYDKYMNETVHQFSQKTEKLSSVHTFATNQEFLLKQLTDNFDTLEDLNISKSVTKAEISLNEFIAEYKIPNITKKEGFNKQVIDNIKSEFLNFTNKFTQENIGPCASAKCLQVLPNFIFETLGSVYSRAIDVFTSELGDAANSAELSSNNLAQMKEYLKTQETSVIELTREKNKLTDELEQLKHDFERLTRTKETEIGSLNDRISKFEEQLQKKKLQNDSLNTEFKDLQDNFLEANEKISSMQREIDSLLKKNEDSEKLIMEYSKTL